MGASSYGETAAFVGGAATAAEVCEGQKRSFRVLVCLSIEFRAGFIALGGGPSLPTHVAPVDSLGPSSSTSALQASRRSLHVNHRPLSSCVQLQPQRTECSALASVGQRWSVHGTDEHVPVTPSIHSWSASSSIRDAGTITSLAGRNAGWFTTLRDLHRIVEGKYGTPNLCVLFLGSKMIFESVNLDYFGVTSRSSTSLFNGLIFTYNRT